MREVISRTSRLASGALDYVSGYINERAREWNLPPIASIEMGYRDIFTGVRAFPALICIVRSARDIDSFSTLYHLLFGLALKGADIDLLQEDGEKFADILEDSVRADGHLGGLAIDTTGISITTDCTGGFYVVSMECDVSIDRGAFANMIEEAGP